MISKNFWLRSVASGPSKVSAERWWSRCVFLVWKHGCNYSNIHQHIHQLVYIYKYYKWGLIAGWWYTYPSAKCDFVSWDDDIPNWMEGHKIHVPNQPVVLITPNISKDINFRIGFSFFGFRRSSSWKPSKRCQSGVIFSSGDREWNCWFEATSKKNETESSILMSIARIAA